MPIPFARPDFPSAAALARSQPVAILLGSLAIAVLMSTQFLFQSFVWQHWPWDEVMDGWLEVMRDRSVVAFCIGLALVAATSAPARGSRMRSVMLGIAILAGAALGELALLAGDARGAPHDAAALIGRISRWTLVAGSVAAMSYLWLRAREAAAKVQALELRRTQLERQAVAARLAALRVQIEPHFLFNTLATVRRLHQTAPSEGGQLLTHFVGYLQSAQPSFQGEANTLGREIALARSYLGVVEARMSGRLRVGFDVPQELSQLEFPPLTIATLVENAIKHGIAPVPAGGTITVSVKAATGSLEAMVADTGAGFASSSGSGIGLANIRARLHTLYGAAGTLSLQSNKPCGVRATIRIPLQQGAA
jgi:hypothetical protein